ncbi:hypothetical protein C5B42_02190 [Candidatus Cerribacteria bacterium 'Amazon FNV 2010 28 9']|uniref:EamA domain-containing protein n=1 Tax=Candidatus Cerribacteria bacterium 'Amazon FNV 2010 28 9' TaxID=2081795 RepID=A0A317JTA6_9BACT|nr:MAG: hypothetical protein C5B42_02190 [Candidatus Cerribacteria bacterium 'Amazon FNV 2010 28 9']
MPWQLYLIASIFFISLNGLWHKSLMKGDNSDPKAQTVVFLSVGGIFVLLLSLLQGGIHLQFSPSLLANFAIVGVFSTIAYVLSYRAYQLIGAGEIAIFLSTGRLWTVIGAALFLHEVLTPIHILGTLIILLGIAIALYDQKKFKLNQGVVLVLIAGFLNGCSDVSGYHILQSMDAPTYQVIVQFLPVLLILMFFPKTIKKIKYYCTNERALKMTLLGIGDALGMLSLYLAYQAGGKASIISPLSATRVILTVALAALFLHERDRLGNKLIGAVITIVGVMFLL